MSSNNFISFWLSWAFLCIGKDKTWSSLGIQQINKDESREGQRWQRSGAPPAPITNGTGESCPCTKSHQWSILVGFVSPGQGFSPSLSQRLPPRALAKDIPSTRSTTGLLPVMVMPTLLGPQRPPQLDVMGTKEGSVHLNCAVLEVTDHRSRWDHNWML